MIDFVLSVGTATTSSTATEMTVTSVIPHHSMQRSLLAFFKPATPAAAPPAPQPAPPAASALPAARKPLRGKRHVEPVEPAATTPKSAPPAPAIAPPADVQRSHAAVEPVVAASAAVLSGSQAVADSTVTPDVAAANRADPAIRWAPQAETATAEPTADTAATDNASASEDEQDDDLDYETQRLRNINENRRLLAQLGLLGGSTGALAEQQPPVAKRAKQPTAKKSRRTSHLTDENAHLYLRRSSRRKDAPPPTLNEDVLLAEIEPEPVQLPLPAIGQACDNLVRGMTERDRVGFASMAHLLASSHTRLYAGHKHNVYTMDCDADNTYLVAAGKGGLLSLFPLNDAQTAPANSDDDVPHQPPTVSAKVHARWVAEVQVQPRGGVLSASDDKCLVFSTVNPAEAAIVPVSRLSNLHSGGIFSMHALQQAIATVGKDGGCALSALRESELSVIRPAHTLCSSVLKSVCWQPTTPTPTVLAAGGNDMTVYVWDTRQDATAMSIEGAHHQSISSVLYHPSRNYTLVTTGFDRLIKVWDMRNTATPVTVFSSVHANGKDRPSLTSPIWWSDRQLLSIGDNTPHVHLLDIDVDAASKPHTQIYIGFTPTCLLRTGDDVFCAQGTNAVWRFKNFERMSE